MNSHILAPDASEPERRAFVLDVHCRLSELYGSNITYFHDLDPLSELVSSLLSHRTRNRDSGQAFRNLRALYPDWAALIDAPVAQVQEAISPCTWPEQKAPRLQQVLREVRERAGSLSLDFLAGLSVPEARAWLEALPGVGPKTSAAVLSFSTMRAKALPVDSHHFRVMVRLGVIPEKLGEARAHAVLEALLPEDFTSQEMYDHHQVVMRHGQKVCHYSAPDCGHCVLLDSCPTGQARMEKQRRA